jgi:glyoxylase-like metal-dependent hydrolase (beta-lactamase superfamily II)
MEVNKIEEGLWQWTAPHPAWTPASDRPDGWGRFVSCVYCEPKGDQETLVLIDPLAPPRDTPDSGKFWSALDRDVERVGRPLCVLIGNEYHSRSAQEIYERYRSAPGAGLWCHEAARPELSCSITGTFPAGPGAPRGIRAISIPTLSPGEVVFFLPSRRVLAVADALLGAGSGAVRVAPASWAPQNDEAQARYQKEFREALRSLLTLDFDRIFVGHGAPVLSDGRRALAEALDAPAWGA